MKNKSVNPATVLVILGATGDLMDRKIVPSLFHLFKKGRLSGYFKVIGFSRRELDNEGFRKRINQSLIKDKDNSDKSNKNFFSLFSYHRGYFENQADYVSLFKEIKAIDRLWKVCSNKLFYLAVPPKFYEVILKNLALSGLTKGCSDEEGWTRILVEKPFGQDLQTAQRLERLLSGLFKESQIYRIDHYLAKELLQDILVFRFSNNLFENNWSNRFIEKIKIRLWEKIGVDDRGGFYDKVGALRDVGQNHLLQMLALITMDNPLDFREEAIREKRESILRTLIPLSPKAVRRFTFRAQYKGYRKINGVAPHSKTETYFKTIAFLSSPRWDKVPIILEGGKRLKEQRKEIIVYLKHPRPCLCLSKQHYQNKVIFSLEPEEGIVFELWRKRPGLSFEIEKHSCLCPLPQTGKKNQYIKEYQKLLYDCIIGDRTLFVSNKEVEAMWGYVDPILRLWEEGSVPLRFYSPGTLEPVKESKWIDQVRSNLFWSEVKSVEINKEIGLIGLGKMGGNIARRLMEKGWKVYGYNKTFKKAKKMEKEGLIAVHSVKELMGKLVSPRIIWLMVPAGKPVDDLLFGERGLIGYLKKGDFVIDGGNSFYKDSIRRFNRLKDKEVFFVDVGVSGGPQGARQGPALMIGGERKVFEKLEPLFKDLALGGGYRFFPGAGAGHFVKMVHNGIEYGMMQAIAEGFAVLKKSDYQLDLKEVADVYNNGSVIESRLIGWLKRAFVLYGDGLEAVSGVVGYSGEGQWTVETAKELKIKTKVIEEALRFRIESEKNPSYIGRVLTSLRNQFGGHSIKS